MKLLQLALLCAVVAVAVADLALPCNSSKCVRPNCLCSSPDPPITGNIPQLVTLSFDDSGSKLVYDQVYEKLLFNRKNPDKCAISGTLYIPHDYTDYTVINSVYNKGFEIGSHSVTKNFESEYWNNANEALIASEMGGQNKIIAKFANIPIKTIVGSRIPHFQLNGEQTYRGLVKAGFVYDSSWPTYSFNPYFPYTLDYLSDQPCLVGTCPEESIPGMWVAPIINWVDMKNIQCNKLLACSVEGTADEIFKWMKSNFERSYLDTKAPISVPINYAWFQATKNSYDALVKFLDYLATLKDVFVVSEKQVIDWMKAPVLADKYSSCIEKRPVANCAPVSCKLQTSEGEERYMGSCVRCPKHYPSLSNPEGT